MTFGDPSGLYRRDWTITSGGHHDCVDSSDPGRAGRRPDYDVRGSDASFEPPILLIGSPMGAGGFGTLAGHFTDRTVVTYDPRGCERSRRTDGAAESTPEEHADDLHRLIATLDAGSVDLFASSGGAVNALALVARRPEQVRTLVPTNRRCGRCSRTARPDWRPAVDIHETYLRSGFGAGDGQVHRPGQFRGPAPCRLRGPARAGSGVVRAAGR